MRPLDRIDRMILDILQREGRIAISELASRVNLYHPLFRACKAP